MIERHMHTAIYYCEYCLNLQELTTEATCCLRDRLHLCSAHFERYWIIWEKEIEDKWQAMLNNPNPFMDFYNKLANQQEDIPPIFGEIFQENFINLLSRS